MIILLGILYHAKLTDNTQLKYQNPTYNKTFLQLYSAFSDHLPILRTSQIQNKGASKSCDFRYTLRYYLQKRIRITLAAYRCMRGYHHQHTICDH